MKTYYPLRLPTSLVWRSRKPCASAWWTHVYADVVPQPSPRMVEKIRGPAEGCGRPTNNAHRLETTVHVAPCFDITSLLHVCKSFMKAECGDTNDRLCYLIPSVLDTEASILKSNVTKQSGECQLRKAQGPQTQPSQTRYDGKSHESRTGQRSH